MTNFYRLKNKVPVPCTFEEWAHDYENAINKQVELTYIGEVMISTVFLGMNHAFGEDKLILFETMIFGGEHDQFQERYSTYDEAEEGHKKAIKMLFEVTH